MGASFCYCLITSKAKINVLLWKFLYFTPSGQKVQLPYPFLLIFSYYASCIYVDIQRKIVWLCNFRYNTLWFFFALYTLNSKLFSTTIIHWIIALSLNKSDNVKFVIYTMPQWAKIQIKYNLKKAHCLLKNYQCNAKWL